MNVNNPPYDDYGNIIFSPDGNTLASATGYNTISLWNVSDGKLKWSSDFRYATSVAFSPDGQTLIGMAYDGSIELWHVPDGLLLFISNGSFGGMAKMALSPDGSLITAVSVYDDGTVRLWGISPERGSSPNQINSGNHIEVPANQSWQRRLIVNPGDTISIKYVSGEWGWTGSRANFDGKGDPDLKGNYRDICTGRNDCLPDAPLSSLIGKIGENGTPFYIGNALTFTVPPDSPPNQPLFLMGNDNPTGLSDNVGSIFVEITIEHP